MQSCGRPGKCRGGFGQASLNQFQIESGAIEPMSNLGISSKSIALACGDEFDFVEQQPLGKDKLWNM